MNTLRNMHIPVLVILAGATLLGIAAAQSNTTGSLAPFLARPASPTRVPDANGFMQRWLILEPISVNGQTESIVRTAVKTAYFANQFTILPHDGDKVMVGDKDLIWHAVDTNDYNLNLDYFAKAFGKTSDNALF